jgi:7-carboxy-7-deazaguanine synthase
MLNVCEIFTSIQGESTRAGLVCCFVRLTGCNLRCAYCDTRYAWEEGAPMSVEEIVAAVAAQRVPLVEITGGEPLVQDETPGLCGLLLERGLTVLVETNGACDISRLSPQCIRIMDIKCPGSGMADAFLESNLAHLTERDECKFVVSDRADFDWAAAFTSRHGLDRLCPVIFSSNAAALSAAELAGWIVEARAPVRLGLQLHKTLWGERRGV